MMSHIFEIFIYTMVLNFGDKKNKPGKSLEKSNLRIPKY
jgi:hypothetical protein